MRPHFLGQGERFEGGGGVKGVALGFSVQKYCREFFLFYISHLLTGKPSISGLSGTKDKRWSAKWGCLVGSALALKVHLQTLLASISIEKSMVPLRKIKK